MARLQGLQRAHARVHGRNAAVLEVPHGVRLPGFHCRQGRRRSSWRIEQNAIGLPSFQRHSEAFCRPQGAADEAEHSTRRIRR